MKYCGIELKGKDAILVGVEIEEDKIVLINSDIKKIKLIDSGDQESVKSFATSVNHFLNENGFDKIAIKARASKGKYAGGSESFKMEGIIQNLNFQVEIIHPATITARLKNIDISEFQVLKYQVEALKTAISINNN